MREIKLRVKVLRPASGRTAHVEPCHLSGGYVGVSLQAKASHNVSNARDVTAGKMGRNSRTKQWCYHATNRYATTVIH